MMTVVYEDNHAIAVIKPAGIPVQADASGDESLMDMVKQDLKTRHHKLGDVFLGLVHRLDRPVSGIVIFGRTSKGASRLSEQFRQHRVTKTYWAMVEGCPEHSSGDIIQWIRKRNDMNIAEAFSVEMPDAKRAELSYRVLASSDDYSLIEVIPKTGRTHQIRLAMRSLNCPIVGDKKYGAEESFLNGRGIALHAVSLSFFTPVGDTPVVLSSRPEWDFSILSDIPLV